MTGVLKPCLSCGEPSEGTRCPDCAAETRRAEPPSKRSKSARARGYDHRWTLVSARARRVQPWCTDCGSTHRLTADHTPTAWARYEAGLPIRVRDVDVVCLACNGARGSSRPGSARWRETFGD